MHEEKPTDSSYMPSIVRHEDDGSKTDMTLLTVEAVSKMQSEINRLRAELCDLLREVDEWKNASQLEIAGDPDGILPRHLAAYIAEQDALCTMLANARHEAARLGYCAGHNDTVEGTYADPSEVAADICQEMDDDERMGENA